MTMGLSKKIVFSFLACVLFLGSCETVLRILRFPPILINDKVKALEKNWQETRDYKGNFVFNNLGLRGRREIGPKPDGVYRIVCLGDSWTFGLNVPEEKSYPSFLEKVINSYGLGTKIEVINAGVPGYKLEEMHRLFVKNMHILMPDCIIFLGGKNGILAEKPPRQGSGGRLRSPFLYIGQGVDDPRIDPENKRYISFYTSKIGSLFSKSYFYNGLSRLIKNSNYVMNYLAQDVFGYKSEESISKYKRERREEILFIDLLVRLQKEGKKIVLLNYPLPKRAKGKIYGTYQDDYDYKDDILNLFLEKDPAFIFIDLFKQFKEIESCNDLFLEMYYEHPNEKGYEVMAHIIGKRLRKEIGGDPFLLKKSAN